MEQAEAIQEVIHKMIENNIIEKLKRIPYFHHLSDEVIEKLSLLAIEVTCSKGDLIFQEGDKSDALYIVINGEGNIYKIIDMEKNIQKSLGFIESDALIGEMGIFTNEPRSATISAMTDMKLLKLKKEDLEKFFLEDPMSASMVMNEFIKVLSEKLRATSKEMITIYEAGEIILSTPDENELLDKIFSLLLKAILNEDSAILAIYNEFTEELEIKKHNGFSVENGDLGDGFLSKKENLIKKLFSDRLPDKGNPSEENLLEEGSFSKTKSIIGAPILSGDKFYGFIACFNHTRENAFTSSERNLMFGICNQLACAIENINLRKEYENMEKLRRQRW